LTLALVALAGLSWGVIASRERAKEREEAPSCYAKALAKEVPWYFYPHYANRVRGERPSEERGRQKHEEEQPKKRRCSPGWARLIAKVFQADPLVCKRCGGPLNIVAYITDTVAIRRILDYLGLSPPEEPPPDIREVVRVPVDDQGREIGASPA
jgi:hypothetical protein